MSRTGIVGRPGSLIHFFPPSTVKYAPNSVPAKRRPGLTWSSAMAHTEPRSGRLPAIETQLLPPSALLKRYGLKSPALWLLNEAYTVLTSWREASTSETKLISGTPGKVSIFRQVTPPSSVAWI